MPKTLNTGPLPRALALAQRYPRVLVAVLLLTGTLLVAYATSSPDTQWPGLLPSSYHSPIQEHDLGLKGGTYPPSAPSVTQSKPLNDILTELYGNFTDVYKQHRKDSAAPKPVYGGPMLTHAQKRRYAHLKTPKPTIASKIKSKGKEITAKYMFTTITRDIVDHLPDLLNTVAVITKYLGPQHVSFSILEGPSSDPTPYVLEQVLRPLLVSLGVPDDQVRIVTNEPKIAFDQVNRIEALAELRNSALKPLWEDQDLEYLAKTPVNERRTVGTDVSAVVFFNDVYLRASDVLELLHQHVVASEGNRGTGITTGWDWLERDPAHFYDVWVARTIDTGDLFYPISWEWWSPSDDILASSPSSRDAYKQLRPFQAFSSWNALAVLSPTPFHQPTNVRFRRSDLERGECAASECTLIASDFWKHGFGRVQVVPSVQLAYTRQVAQLTKVKLREAQAGLGWIDGVPSFDLDTTVKWITTPPKQVRCHPWPEQNGLNANVWATKEWVEPYII